MPEGTRCGAEKRVTGEHKAGSWRSECVLFALGALVPALARAQVGAPVIVQNGVVNAASLQHGVASSTWVAVFGTNLAPVTRVWRDADFSENRLPTALDGVSVLFNGKPGFVYFISPIQINVLAPDDAVGTAAVEVVTPRGKSTAVTVQRQALAPAFFTLNLEGRKYAAALHLDGSLVGKASPSPGVTTRPARPGDIISLFGTGFGPTEPAISAGLLVHQAAKIVNPPLIRLGGVAAGVQFAGLVAAGLNQINLTVPNVPDGDASLTGEVGGARTQADLFLAVQASRGVWSPVLRTSWQIQLSGLPVDQSFNVDMYDIDLFDNDAGVVASLHARGRKVVCYLSVGSWENFRPDAGRFPESVRGKPLSGWPDEQWLDIRRLDILAPVLEARLELCKLKGFDGADPDNVDGYINDTGFPLTYQDQIRFNTFIANAAHARGLSVGLKNDLDQVQELLPYFEWTLNEQCFAFKECDKLLPFIRAGKAVFQLEYELETSQFCPQANVLNFNSLRKNLQLDAFRQACR